MQMNDDIISSIWIVFDANFIDFSHSVLFLAHLFAFTHIISVVVVVVVIISSSIIIIGTPTLRKNRILRMGMVAQYLCFRTNSTRYNHTEKFTNVIVSYLTNVENVYNDWHGLMNLYDAYTAK